MRRAPLRQEDVLQERPTSFARAVRVMAGGALLLSIGGGCGGDELSSDERSPYATGAPASFKNRLGMTFVRIPGGTYTMGLGALRSVPEQTVTVGELTIAVDETSNVEFEAFKANHRNHRADEGQGDAHPASFLKWQEAVDYGKWLTAFDGSGITYRLPTEAEWEWAARGGDAADVDMATRSEANSYGVGGKDVWPGQAPVDTRQLDPNPFGLYQMLGNVSEWVTTPGDAKSSTRVHKGRSFNSGADLGMTPGDRQLYSAGEYGRKVGFRLVAILPDSPPAPPAPTPPTPPTTPAPTGTSLALTVTQPGDDAQEKSGTVKLLSPTINLGWGTLCGLRFTSVAIPRGATITSAVLSVAAEGTSRSQALSLTYRGEASGSAAAFGTTGVAKLSARPRTRGSASFASVPGWADRDRYYDSVDLGAIVQEIVDQPSWAAGHALALFVEGSAATGRVIWSSEGHVKLPPKLRVTFVQP